MEELNKLYDLVTNGDYKKDYSDNLISLATSIKELTKTSTTMAYIQSIIKNRIKIDPTTESMCKDIVRVITTNYMTSFEKYALGINAVPSRLLDITIRDDVKYFMSFENEMAHLLKKIGFKEVVVMYYWLFTYLNT